MHWLRLLRVVLHLFAGLATCAFAFPLMDAAARRRRVQRWSARLLAICGVQVKTTASELAQPALIISNHVSWLDIFVINSLEPCRFVAKSDIRDWPLIGWLCAKTGTIFISRGRMRDVRHIYQGLVKSLHDGERIAFFPEGTTSSQGTVLPFHANLFEAAIEARVPVQPCALRYLDPDGQLHADADFIGEMTFVESLIGIVKSNAMVAELMVLPVVPVSESMHRRELAEASRKMVAEALQVP
jgi:1-acyl-sn-glycerol-3-phosphate acyltransferase